jgi:hypothetical protein
MGTPASAPPGDGDPANVAPAEDEDLEMTSVMDAEQRRALQKAARAEAEKAAAAAAPKEEDRATARPPPGQVPSSEGDVAIPKAPKLPSEAPAALAPAAAPAPARVAPAAAARRSVSLWHLVAFVLLVASVLFALR